MEEKSKQERCARTPTKLYIEEQRLKRLHDRKRDCDLLKAQRLASFDWNMRYDAEYILAYAREHGWNASRLRTAITTVDDRERIARNSKAARP